jgi:hypothetical protein
MAHRLKKGGRVGSSKSKPRKTRKWSAGVMRRSDALDLEPGVFTKTSPRQIASSLKRSALRSRRRKGTPFQSAMSMLNFHINRGGKNLAAVQKHRLEQAKEELRRLFGRNRERRRPSPSQAGSRKSGRNR